MQKPHFQRPASRRSGFTIIELLVVITVIAILMAILIPTLRMAKRAGNLAQCSSNLHQIAEGLASYYVDSRGQFVNTDPTPSWDSQMAIGIWKDWKTARMQSMGSIPLTKSPLYPYIMDTSTAWICPADPHGMQLYSWPPYPVQSDQAYYVTEGSSYLWNSWLVYNGIKNMTRIPNPAKFVQAYEWPVWDVCNNGARPSWWLSMGVDRWSFHDDLKSYAQTQNRNNTLFFDGHVSIQTFVQNQWHANANFTFDGN